MKTLNGATRRRSTLSLASNFGLSGILLLGAGSMFPAVSHAQNGDDDEMIEEIVAPQVLNVVWEILGKHRPNARGATYDQHRS